MTATAKIMPSDIVDEVYTVLLKHTNTGRGVSQKSITAYIGLERLERVKPGLRDNLISQRGMPGKNGGTQYSAAHVFSDACEMLARESPSRVAIEYADYEGEYYSIAGQIIEAGYSGGVCARYRAL